MTLQQSWRHLGRILCAARKPILIAAERYSELFIVDAQVAVAATHHRIRHHGLYLLRDHADIRLLAANVAETVVAEAVGEMAEQDDVVLQRDVGAPPAASAATSTPASAETATTAAATSCEAR